MQDFQELYDKAHEAGHAAAMACRPRPMVVVEHRNPLDDPSPITKVYEPVMDGVCGFAWINVKPGTSAFAKWLKAEGYARKDEYEGGVTLWVGDYGQSYERKRAYAYAFSDVVFAWGVGLGLKVRVGSRLD